MRSLTRRLRLSLLAVISLCALLGATLMPTAANAAVPARSATLSGTTSVTTAPGIALTLLKAGILPLPVLPQTRFTLGFQHGLNVTYGFPITGGDPSLANVSGDILHSGGIYFASLKGKHLAVTNFDIDLAAGKVYATKVNGAAAKVALLDLDLSGLKVSTPRGATVLRGITLRLDPAGAGALNATFGVALPTDGSLVFGSAVVQLRAS
ncbi:hypothetical protein SAMN05892883_1715 [Jatrophihabitans sp. GAS493]|uniref:hypothetical protein n=1 Tax=Jatrophihabitans sp. GAS493 TaxID=1907575 RepID=UPI000BC0456A|nr:hypothetical protein [Jatrophihabitans sp. GAS493]SOD72312.1 hypothetical protein SAMN05892883_1715 [Jatrophihabitans sp. GAS493]